MRHHITKYESNGNMYAEAWLQINMFGKCFCFCKKRIKVCSKDKGVTDNAQKYENIKKQQIKNILRSQKIEINELKKEVIYIDSLLDVANEGTKLSLKTNKNLIEKIKIIQREN